MSKTVIEINNLGKQYRLGNVGTGTMSDDLKRFLYKLRGKEDPFLKVGESNDRTKKGSSEYVWALKDVNFKVEEGEVLGIIGKNGAGKSTLLKILSRTTLPTTGEYKIKGRVASLLEVGTGFHPDLTGRENIFLNGAILGMNKAEIRKQFDAIVDFSGVERYIDTPVKRYSSGMYVRLAFAVAAHLEPEILIVDEVLAVGDAEFQKKCLGKMKDVSGQGRTVLFVSHNMPTMRTLCDKCLFLKNGEVNSIGLTDKIIGEYISSTQGLLNEGEIEIPSSLSLYHTGEAKFKKAWILNSKNQKTNELEFLESFSISFELESNKFIENVSTSVYVVNQFGERILMSTECPDYKPTSLKLGTHYYQVDFSEKLMPGNYSIGLSVSFFNTGASIDYVESFFPFTVLKESKTKNMEYPWSTVHGYVRPETKWTKQ
jgi:lipopolysaccharide transport system ATP-binding protein